MAIHYMEKHAQQIDEAFAAASVTERAVNANYDFTGVRTVKVHSVPTVPMGDYQAAGMNRYGVPAELEDSVQELTLTPDRAFSFIVDKGSSEDDAALNAGAALRRQIDQQITPEVDRYRFARMAAGAKTVTYGPVKGTGATGPYERLLDLQAAMDDDGVPREGRVLFVTSAFYKALKLDANFIKAGDVAQGMLRTGQIGEVDGLPVYRDEGRMPAGVEALIAHPEATTAPWKLSEYKQHMDPPGVSGVLVEGRNRYDAFVLDRKRGALAAHRSAKLSLAPVNEAGGKGATRFPDVGGAAVLEGSARVPMGALCVRVSDAAIADKALGDDLSDLNTYPEFELGEDIACAAGSKVRVYLKDQNGRLIGESAQLTAAVGA